MMLVHIFQVGFDDFGTVVGMVDLNTVNWYLGAQLIQQVRVIEGEVLLTTAGVSNQTNRPTAVRRLHRLRHISHDCAETSLAYHPQRGLPICHVSMFTQQAAIVRRST